MVVEQLEDLVFPLLGNFGWLVAISDAATAVDQEVGEIPVDDLLVGVCLEPSVQWVLLRPVDVDLRHHVKGDAVSLLHMGQNFGIGAWFLAAELVAGKAENRESVLLILFPIRL